MTKRLRQDDAVSCETAFVDYWFHKLPDTLQKRIEYGNVSLAQQVHYVNNWLQQWILQLHTPVLLNILRRLDNRSVMRFCAVSKAFHTFCHKYLTIHRSVYTFGSGGHDRLGNDNIGGYHVGVPLKIEKIFQGPLAVDGAFQEHVVGVSCGTFHTALWTTQGHVYTFGNGRGGRLGDGNTRDHHVGTPLKIEGPFQGHVVCVSCGEQYTTLWTCEITFVKV